MKRVIAFGVLLGVHSVYAMMPTIDDAWVAAQQKAVSSAGKKSELLPKHVGTLRDLYRVWPESSQGLKRNSVASSALLKGVQVHDPTVTIEQLHLLAPVFVTKGEWCRLTGKEFKDRIPQFFSDLDDPTMLSELCVRPAVQFLAAVFAGASDAHAVKGRLHRELVTEWCLHLGLEYNPSRPYTPDEFAVAVFGLFRQIKQEKLIPQSTQKFLAVYQQMAMRVILASALLNEHFLSKKK